MAAVSEADLKAVFDSFDADKSGFIDAKELVNALSQLYGKEQAEKLAQEILKECDQNADKKISWDEFKKASSA